MNNPWLKKHRKAIAGGITAASTEVAALVALGVLPGAAAHIFAVGLLAATPVLTFLGIKISAANA